MKPSAETLAEKLIGHLTNIEKTRMRSEELFSQGYLVKRDIEIIYSGLFMDAITSFERFVEELFLYLLAEKITHSSSKVKPKATFDSIDFARSMIKGDKAYIDWFPYALTTKRAKVYFSDGLPFVGLDKLDKIKHTRLVNRLKAHARLQGQPPNPGPPQFPSVPASKDKRINKSIERFMIIRNVLAHKSKHAFKAFQNEVISATPLSTREKQPIGYLRGRHSTTPINMTRYEQIISEIQFIATLITSQRL
jgi:hypothetical protein